MCHGHQCSIRCAVRSLLSRAISRSFWLQFYLAYSVELKCDVTVESSEKVTPFLCPDHCVCAACTPWATAASFPVLSHCHSCCSCGGRTAWKLCSPTTEGSLLPSDVQGLSLDRLPSAFSFCR